jgi:hypothetical protein
MGGGAPHYAPAGHVAAGGARAYGGYGGYGGAAHGYGGYAGGYHGGAAYAGRGYGGGYYHGGYGGYHGYSTGAYWGGGWWRGGYWPRAYYGVGYSWFLASLPLAYATYWYSGIPYYYANNLYYTWSPDYSGYVATDPPPVADSSGAAAGPDAPPPAAQSVQQYPTDPNAIDASGQPTPPPADAPPPAPQAGAGDPPQQNRIFMYPKNGQSQEKQSSDRRECQQWAAQQAGASNAPDYQRAMVACIEGRGYAAN